MTGLCSSEIIFFTGMMLMAAACVLAVISIIIFRLTGKRLRERLEQEYGEPRR
ncbi:MAG: hypothetical protein J6C19_00015 [Lachnospiraceae bacterium]|nr:hypothetical protein [Lachnospiraceae bacterium]